VAADDAELTETWTRMMGLFMSRRNVLFEAFAEFQLTPPHGHALITLLHGGPTRMRDMATTMACDASYVTVVADRLEELGLTERRPTADDRRVKELALTKKGERVAGRLNAVFTEPPAELRALSPADQATLSRITKLLFDGAPDTDWMPSRSLR
jgi:DNA-binding MarR family transcriptional regulator